MHTKAIATIGRYANKAWYVARERNDAKTMKEYSDIVEVNYNKLLNLGYTDSEIWEAFGEGN